MTKLITIGELERICRTRQNIYVYGAGNFARILLWFFVHKNISIKGFVVTEKNNQAVFNYYVYDINEVMIEKNDIIVLAMNEKNREEVIDLLEQRGLESYCYIDDFEYDILCRKRRDSKYIELEEYINEFPASLDLRQNQWKKILIIQLDLLGDLIWTTPMMRELRSAFPDAQIDMIVRKPHYQVLENCPYLDNVFLYEYDMNVHDENTDYDLRGKNVKTKRFFDNNSLECNYDVSFISRCLQEYDKIEQLLLAINCGSKYRFCYGYIHQESTDMRFIRAIAPAFTNFLGYTRFKHHVDCRLDMLRICNISVDNDDTELWIDESQREYIREFKHTHKIDEKDITILVGINGSIDNKNWDTNNYSTLFNKIYSRYGDRVVLLIIGDASAHPRANRIFSKARCINLVGYTDIKQVIALASMVDIYLGADTGLAHLCAAFKKQEIVISPWISGDMPNSCNCVGPWNTNYIFMHPQVGIDGCEGYCRKNYSHCINTIRVEDVFTHLEKMFVGLQGAKEKSV